MDALLDRGQAPDKDSRPSDDQQSVGSGRRKEKNPEIRGRLDLHGHSVEEALVRLEAFIVRSSARDFRRVLVITGRGLRSSGGVPVLRRAVSAWLRREGLPWVAEVDLAPRQLGGEGALVVRLRRPRSR